MLSSPLFCFKSSSCLRAFVVQRVLIVQSRLPHPNIHLPKLPPRQLPSHLYRPPRQHERPHRQHQRHHAQRRVPDVRHRHVRPIPPLPHPLDDPLRHHHERVHPHRREHAQQHH